MATGPEMAMIAVAKMLGLKPELLMEQMQGMANLLTSINDRLGQIQQEQANQRAATEMFFQRIALETAIKSPTTGGNSGDIGKRTNGSNDASGTEAAAEDDDRRVGGDASRVADSNS